MLGLFCQSQHESLIEEIEDLIQKEKYEKALALLYDRLSANRPNAEILSKNKPNLPRLLVVSEDRTKVVWTENKTLFAKDIVLGTSHKRELKLRPDSIQISNNGKFVSVQYPLKQMGGCAIFSYSTFDSELEHESIAHIPCKTGMAPSSDGSKLFYFFEGQLFFEEIGKKQKPQAYLSADKFPPPFPKLKHNFHIVSIGNEYLIWSGIAGTYHLYHLQPSTKKVTLVSKDIVVPRFYYDSLGSGFVVAGKIGDLYLKEVKYTSGKQPTISRGIPIANREAYSWKLPGKEEFLSTNMNEPNQPMKWKVLGKKEHFPFFLERVWSVMGDRMLYENKRGELILDDLNFTEQDKLMYEYYKKVKKLNDT